PISPLRQRGPPHMDSIGRTTGSGLLIGSHAAPCSSNQPVETTFCCCCGRGDVGNARSVVQAQRHIHSRVAEVAGCTPTPVRHRRPVAGGWCGRVLLHTYPAASDRACGFSIYLRIVIYFEGSEL